MYNLKLLGTCVLFYSSKPRRVLKLSIMDFKTNTSFNIANTSSQEDFDDDYILIYKDINNILDDIGFQSDDRILCKSIIESLEKEASINIRKDKCVAIPHIGTIQKNWYRSKLISHYKDFKEARKL